MGSTPVSVSRVADLLAEYAPLRCWKVCGTYGSFVYFELGSRLRYRNAESEYDIGSASLWVYADDWQIADGARRLADSLTVTDQIVDDQIAKAFIGKQLSDLATSAPTSQPR